MNNINILRAVIADFKDSGVDPRDLISMVKSVAEEIYEDEPAMKNFADLSARDAMIAKRHADISESRMSLADKVVGFFNENKSAMTAKQREWCEKIAEFVSVRGSLSDGQRKVINDISQSLHKRDLL